MFARELVQLDTGKKVSPDPKTWIDEETGEQSDNLWLNLSDGYVGGGRRQMNANGEWTGSGSALKHFEEVLWQRRPWLYLPLYNPPANHRERSSCGAQFG